MTLKGNTTSIKYYTADHCVPSIARKNLQTCLCVFNIKWQPPVKFLAKLTKKWTFVFMQQIVNIPSLIIEKFNFNCRPVNVNMNYLETSYKTILLYHVIPQGPPWFQWLNLCLPTSPIIGNSLKFIQDWDASQTSLNEGPSTSHWFHLLKMQYIFFWFTTLPLQCDLTSSASNLGFISFSTWLSFKSNKTMTSYIYQSNIEIYFLFVLYCRKPKLYSTKLLKLNSDSSRCCHPMWTPMTCSFHDK